MGDHDSPPGCIVMMDRRTVQKLALIRRRLSADPSRIVAGRLHEGCAEAESGVAEWDQVLAILNGGNCGVFDLWSTEELAGNQFYSATMPGAREEWLVIGQLTYEPIAVNRRTGRMVCFPADGPSLELGDIRHFVADFLFGERYKEVVADVEQDPWWQLLKEVNRVIDQSEW